MPDIFLSNNREDAAVAKTVVVLWSSRSVASRWVRAEATIAERNETLTPVMIEPGEPPVREPARNTLSRLRDAEPDASRALVESLVRDFYGGTGAVEEHLAIARKVWDKALGQRRPT
jgi:hypothetical protein